MKAFVDKDACISCGLCPSICPEVFEMQDDGKAGVCDDGNEESVVDEELLPNAEEAAETCPVDAISIE